ncbi:MAG: magnesium transporter [Deltaproteobacteria bacterium]|nr:magnesium transporter [Deltaproteobacteria bacterium]
MALFGEIFLSEILSKSVFDPRGEVIGRVMDVVVVKGEPLPKVHSLIIKRKKKLFEIKWDAVNIFNKRIISTSLYTGGLSPYEQNKKDLLTVRDILDKQIVDINGVKIVRVNDIKLEGYGASAVLLSVDVGLRGILRRLGVERWSEEVFNFFTARLPQNLITWNYLQPLKPELKAITLTVARQNVSELHPADLAEIISQVSREEGGGIINDLDIETAADTISELGPEMQVEILNQIETARASDIIEEMSPNEAADVLNNMPTERAKEILENVEREEAQSIQELLGYEEDTAGGMMTNEYLAYHPGLSVKEVFVKFREDVLEIQDAKYIYVIDAGEKLLGVVTLKELILAAPDARLEDIMEHDLKTVAPDVKEKAVAEKMAKYSLVAIPVVSGEGEIVGIVTIGGIIDWFLMQDKRTKRRSA